MPELHVIAAGSLLEFALEEVTSFGVGRIRSLYMYLLTFDEYLRAMGFLTLADRIKISSPENLLSKLVHHTALQHLIQFILIGGMPQVVATYAKTGRLYECRQILNQRRLTIRNNSVIGNARRGAVRRKLIMWYSREQIFCR